jgi:sec-independent protein translocase protein TatA
MSRAFAIIDGLGGPEVLFIFVLGLLLFGSKRLPELGRAFGRAMREFKRATSGVEEGLREAMREPAPLPALRTPAGQGPARPEAAALAASPPPPAANELPFRFDEPSAHGLPPEPASAAAAPGGTPPAPTASAAAALQHPKGGGVKTGP